MPRAVLVPATRAHFLAVADRLRQADRDELEALHGVDMGDVQVRRAMLLGCAAAGPAMAAVDSDDGAELAVLGCAPISLSTGLAAPWLLGAEGVERYARDFLTLGRAEVVRWSAEWPRLENRADARNTRTLRWLQRIGFTLDAPAPRGPQRMPFVRFSRCA